MSIKITLSLRWACTDVIRISLHTTPEQDLKMKWIYDLKKKKKKSSKGVPLFNLGTVSTYTKKKC